MPLKYYSQINELTTYLNNSGINGVTISFTCIRDCVAGVSWTLSSHHKFPNNQGVVRMRNTQ